MSTWECKACTFQNAAKSKRCAMCSSQQPAEFLETKANGEKDIESEKCAQRKNMKARSASSHTLGDTSSAVQTIRSIEEGGGITSTAASSELPSIMVTSTSDTSFLLKVARTNSANAATSSRSRRGTAGPWSCTLCSFENPWLSVTCSMCQSARPSLRTENESWNDAGGGDRHAYVLEQQEKRLAAGKRRKVVTHDDRSENKTDDKSVSALKELARFASSLVGASSPLAPLRPLASILDPSKPAPKSRVHERRSTEKRHLALGSRSGKEAPERRGPASTDASNRRISPSSHGSSNQTRLPGTHIRYAFQNQDKEWFW